MNIPLFFGLVGLMGCIYIWIGKCASKDLLTSDDYFLMGRKLTFFPLSLTLLATQLGGGTLLGAAQEAYFKGWYVLLFPLGTTLGFFALGMGFGGKLRKLNISTIAEIFEKTYAAPNLRKIASGLSIITMFCILVAQGIAAKLFFVAMGVESPFVFILFWASLVLYTLMGGLKAVVNTDVFQALFIIFTLCVVFFSADLSVIPEVQVTLPSPPTNIPWTAWLFMPLLFMFIEQDMGQRCFAAKNARVITPSAFVGGIVLLFCSAIGIYFGVLARELNLDITEGSSVLIESVKAVTNPTISTFFMVAIFMAIISSADSILCSIGSNLTCDFLSSKKVSTSKILTLVVGIGSLGAAFLFNNVVTMLTLSYELSVCILFVPIAAAILVKEPSRFGAYLAMTLGAIGFILFKWIDTPFPGEVITIALSFLGYLIGKTVKQKRLKEVQT